VVAGAGEPAPEALKSAVGSLAALETLKLLTGFAEPLAGRVLVLDGLGSRVREAAV
jgi:adenylyltransferase/sulfurtransferase